jgi:hypothetical protein
MELLHASPAQIWRLLIPSSLWMFPDDLPEDELIFHYRDHIYFVNNDGSVLALAKPASLERLDVERLLELLATSDETIDFDDVGEFDYAFVLKRMGYIAPVRRDREKATYQVEIVNTIAPEAMITRYELKKVSFTFALYHALMRCHELNRRSGWEYEHEVKRITKVEKQAADKRRYNT